MLKVKNPSALVYGYNQLGEFELDSDVCWEEGLIEKVSVFSYESDKELQKHLVIHQPDVIITIGNVADYAEVLKVSSATFIKSKWHHIEEFHQNAFLTHPNVLANLIAIKATEWACSVTQAVYENTDKPFFSVFTGAFNTGEKLYRTYESLVNQIYPNWEWIVIDDSEDSGETWNILQEIAKTDYRVRPYKLTPTSNRCVGEVKHRACMLANGGWLVELDHDDYLMPFLLSECVEALKEYPDAGFIYTDVTEVYEDGTPRQYSYIGEDYYGHPDNTFAFGFAGHVWEEIDGKTYLTHKYPEINPKTIRFNIGMPNHARIWKKSVYHQIGGHNRYIQVADDFELILKTFLHTKLLHIPKMCYIQYNNRNTTVDSNVTDINRRSRLIRDYYDQRLHKRIEELGKEDWNWNPTTQRSYTHLAWMDKTRFGETEQVLNYIYR